VTTISVKGNELAAVLSARLPDSVVASDDIAVWAAPDRIVDVCRFLRDDPEHDYKMLASLTAVDDVAHFDVVYHLTSLAKGRRAVVKVRLHGRDDLSLPSVTGVWKGADLQEREAYDLLGVRFTGHPMLKRLLTWEGFGGHPLRRDYLEPPLPYTWPQGG